MTTSNFCRERRFPRAEPGSAAERRPPARKSGTKKNVPLRVVPAPAAEKRRAKNGAGKAVGRNFHAVGNNGETARSELRRERFRAQMRLIEGALRFVLSGVFGRHLPGDLLLAELFRSDRRCGSRDRAAMSAGVYAVLRHWGVLRRMLPEDLCRAVESGGAEKISPRELFALLTAALICDGGHDELVRSLAKEIEAELPPLPAPGAAWESRVRVAASLTGCDLEPSADMLIPDWVRLALPPDFPVAAWCASLTRRPPLWLRLQGEGAERAVIAELESAELEFRREPRLRGALAVTGGKVNLFSLDTYRKGFFEVQDLASQCVGAVCAPRPGERWYDPCAGAGGKTLQLAELMRRRGVVLAGDVRERKLEELRRRARRGGFSNVSARLHDGRPPRGMHPADGLLIDAPCSGSGVWRRNPGLQWILSPEKIAEYASRQLDILEAFYPMLKPGGVLVYATCSVFFEENEAVVRRFTERHDDLVPEEFEHPLGFGKVPGGMVRFHSADGDCDTLFAARLRRRIR